MEARVVQNTSLIVACQHNEGFPGSCDRPTLVYVMDKTAYVTCEAHGTFRRVENRHSLTVSKKRDVTVVR